MGQILLYYKYVHIKDPAAIASWQRELCESLHLTGRILLAHEGINGTVGGSKEATKKYIEAMNNHELFGNIDFKCDPGDATAFPKLKISIKEEIVRLGQSPEDITVQDTGKHLNPDEVQQLLDNKPKDLVILDTRNDYEWRVGKFKDAILPPIKTFREFPEYIDKNIDLFKERQVLMYCTGGVRCERATAYLQQKGVAKDIMQVKGGIRRYVEKYPEGHFRGKNYVFDGRVTVRVNDDVLTTCDLCDTRCDDYTNCKNALCNKHFIACKNCIEHYNNTCSQTCKNLILQNQTIERPERQKVDF